MAELVQTPASVVGSGTPKAGTAGEAIDAGMPVFKDSADDNKLKKSRGSSLALAQCDGIALNSAATGQPMDYQSDGLIDLGAVIVVGETYVVSDATAGKIRPIGDLGAGDYPVILGVARTASQLNLKIAEAQAAKP